MRKSFSLSLLLFVTLLLSCSLLSHGKKTVNPYKDTVIEADKPSDNGKKRSSVSIGDDERKKRRLDIDNLLPPNTIGDKIGNEKKSRIVALEENQVKDGNDKNKKASKSEGSDKAGDRKSVV